MPTGSIRHHADRREVQVGYTRLFLALAPSGLRNTLTRALMAARKGVVAVHEPGAGAPQEKELVAPEHQHVHHHRKPIAFHQTRSNPF